MIELANLEVHAAHGCDHACQQCSHFSNYHFGGVLSCEDADEQFGHWSGRLRPKLFSILGGEPTIHPDLTEFIRVSHRHWKNSQIQLVTNGSFLHRHPALPEALEECGVSLQVSVHFRSPEYDARVVEIKQLINSWRFHYWFPVRVRESSTHWRRTLRSDMLPYDSDPERAWNVCHSRWCPQILDGKLYKCPQTAYLPMLAQKLSLASKWEPYLQYVPLEPGCSDDELAEFVSRKVEPVCRMCPAREEMFRLPNPL